MSHPRCTPEAIGLAFTTRDDSDEAREAQASATAALGAYLMKFAAPGKGCIGCGSVLGGNRDNLFGGLFGTFEWGLVHGEGRCGKCGHPGRAQHYVSLGDDGECQFSFILQYHPDDLVLAPDPRPESETPPA